MMSANADVNSKSNTNSDKAPKRATKRNVSPLWSVITKANRVFAVQITKDNKCKLNCLKNAMVSKYSDHDKFWVEYHKHTSTLLDSRRFCKECVDYGCNPAYVAEHIVFEGSATMKEVLKRGVRVVLGEGIRLYKERFTEDVTDKFITEVEDCVVAEVKNKLTEIEKNKPQKTTPEQATKPSTQPMEESATPTPEQTPEAEEQQSPEQTPDAA